MTATRIGKIAAALAALLFAYILKSTIMDYATEPKVIGGVDFDKPIPQAIPWTPVYYPMLLSMAFAYWIWPTRAYANLARRMVSGFFAILRASYFAMFISFFCALTGEFYLSLSNLTRMEILWGPVGVFLGALGGTAMFGLFFVLWFFVFSVFFGCLIVLVVHGASKYLPAPADQPLNFVSRSSRGALQ
jgi:hypothetical protein